MTAGTSMGDSSSSALARKRRKVKLSRKNENDKRLVRDDDDEYDDDEPEEVLSGERKKPHITGIKRQARYDPGVSMTRDELTVWRKEARRVRNRESAAQSRARTRDKIDELAGELATLGSKYAAALERIAQLEAAASSNDSLSPVTVSQEEAVEKEPVVSPISSPELTSVVSPVSSPRSSFSLNVSHHYHQEKVEEKYQHIMDLIIRPTAAKITGAGTTSSLSNDDNDDVHIPSHDSIEAIDDVEMGDFLLEALSDTTDDPIDELQTDSFLDSLCAV
eukprot:CAMPEP_0119010820 /NCGR_PEP_ID=MMETSP1176-20130426/5270_1 /TAXON_ID=265551 /ORGANISM="Synedropsis recta cf, Strain CCMP1620" /LENGTH=276 /DNA_ID=CAMNT_0006963559 /DNA_START=52 /DNA_END=882 /DNA_ORIENTATION=-